MKEELSLAYARNQSNSKLQSIEVRENERNLVHRRLGGGSMGSRDPSPATMLGMDLKSAFGKKRLELAQLDQRSSASKPPIFNNQHEMKLSLSGLGQSAEEVHHLK